MSEIRTIFKNSSWMVGSQLITNLCAFFWTILMARYLGASDFGILSFAISIANILGIFIDFGMQTYIVRVISRDHALTSEYFEKAIPIKCILAVIVLLFTAVFLYLTGRSDLIIKVSIIIILEYIFLSFNSFIYGIFQAYEKLEYQSISSVINAIILLIIVFLTIFFDWGVYGMAFAYLIGMVSSFIYICYELHLNQLVTRHFNFDWEFSKKLLKASLPFGLMSVFYSIYFSIDMTMLGYLSTDAAVGLYNAAYKIITLLTTFYFIYPQVIFPVMSKLYENSADLLRLSYEKSIKYLLLIILPICAGIIIYAVPLMNLIYGNQYAETGPIMTVLIFTIPFLFVNGASTVAMNSSDNEMNVTKIYAVAALVNVILNLILIPEYSYMGAAAATVISEIVICILMFRITLKSDYAPGRVVIFDTIKLLIATVVMFAVLYYSGVNIILGVIIGAIVYAVMIFVTKTFDDVDKHIIKEIINRN